MACKLSLRRYTRTHIRTLEITQKSPRIYLSLTSMISTLPALCMHTHPLTHSLTHSPTLSLTNSLISSALARSSQPWLATPSPYHFTHLSNPLHQLTHSLTHSLTNSLISSVLTRKFRPWLVTRSLSMRTTSRLRPCTTTLLPSKGSCR